MVAMRNFTSIDIATVDNTFAQVYCKQLKCIIPCGSTEFAVKENSDFVLFDTSSTFLIGDILCIAHSCDQIPLDEYDPGNIHKSLPNDSYIMLHIYTTLDKEWYTQKRLPASDNPRYRFVHEVAVSSEYCWIPASFIVDLAFIFTPSTIEKSFVNIQGMKRASFVRYTSGGQELNSTFISFPDDYEDFGDYYAESFPKRIWRSLSALQLELRRAMNTTKSSSGLYSRQKRVIATSTDVWSYLSHITDLEGCCKRTDGKKLRIFMISAPL